MNYSYVPIERIFAKVVRDLTDNFDEGSIVEWTGEALEFIGCSKSYEEAVAFIEVKNHQCDLPEFLHAVIQVARNNRWTPEVACVTPASVVAEAPNIFYQQCSSCNGQNTSEDMGYVVLDGMGTPVVEYDIAYYRPYFDLLGEYYGWNNCGYRQQAYTPVRLSTNSFFNSLVCTERDNSPYQSCTDEYTIIRGSKLRFSFLEGSVAVAYLRPVRDEKTGYPMIPDNISYTTAIVAYIAMKMSGRDYFAQREGAKGRKDDYERDWQWYCKQAGNIDMMPYGIDEHQNLLDQVNYLLPNHESYYGFFGNLARPEAGIAISAAGGKRIGGTSLTQITNEG